MCVMDPAGYTNPSQARHIAYPCVAPRLCLTISLACTVVNGLSRRFLRVAAAICGTQYGLRHTCSAIRCLSVSSDGGGLPWWKLRPRKVDGKGRSTPRILGANDERDCIIRLRSGPCHLVYTCQSIRAIAPLLCCLTMALGSGGLDSFEYPRIMVASPSDSTLFT